MSLDRIRCGEVDGPANVTSGVLVIESAVNDDKVSQERIIPSLQKIDKLPTHNLSLVGRAHL
jgi:hypothetical protein